MLRGLLLLVIGVVALGAVLAFAAVTWTRWSLVDLRTPLPPPAAVAGASQAVPLPLRLSWINTASQLVPRAAVLDAGADPDAGQWTRMAFPVFVLEWADGRILLVDAGMDGPAARRFGVPIERVAGGDPIEPATDVAAALGPARERVAGIVFTHLHEDHVQGVEALCRASGRRIAALLPAAQADRPMYLTRANLELLRTAPCIAIERLPDRPMNELPGFPGISVIAAAGHTPGTQLVVAQVGSRESRPVVLAGDVVNSHTGIEHDVPKPWLYRLLVVPEDDGRLRELRRYLRELVRQFDVTVLVSHDQTHLEASGVPVWPAPRP